MSQIEQLLREGARRLGVSLSAESVEGLCLYVRELERWSKRINLTALRGQKEIATGLVLHSLVLAGFIKGRTLMDIGTGSGVPGLVLKIALPELEVVLVESVEKKCHFLRHIIRTLGLKEVVVENRRAEDPALIERYRGSVDSVVARALSGFEEFSGLARPFVRKGGLILNLRSPKEKEELEGLEGVECHPIEVPFSGEKTLVVVKRVL